MSISSKIKTVIKDPKVICRKFMTSKLSRFISDKRALKIHYKLLMNQKLSLDNPQTFNEKIQWLKLYNRNDKYTSLIDKYAVKNIVAEWIGEEYIIPTIAGPFESFDDIDFDSLPDQFVIKCTHDSAGLVICRDKSALDKEAAREKIQKCLKNNFYWRYREWAYKNIKPQIIVEKYMQDSQSSNKLSSLTDYKFFTFNGEAKFLYISEGLERHDTAHISFFDLNGNMMPFKRMDYNGFEQSPKMPMNMENMIELANKLSNKVGTPFLRVDLYEIDGSIYFSELTFYPHAGYIPFEPKEYDRKLGDLIIL